MRPWAPRAVAVPALALSLLAAVLPACADEPACASDTDCDALSTCVDGACQPIELPEGACVDDNDCSAGEGCKDGACVTRAELVDLCGSETDPACGEGTICTMPPENRTCPDGAAGCQLKFACAPELGEKVGATRCEADAECRSGFCVLGACLRACTGDGACPPRFACRERDLGDGRLVRTCLGQEDGVDQPERTLCRGDRDCEAPRICRFADVAASFGRGEDFGVCAIPPEGAIKNGLGCDPTDPAMRCEYGVCRWSCQSLYPAVCQTLRCTMPCQAPEDCPPRWTCQEDRDLGEYEGEYVRYCTLSLDGCYDDLDCCPIRDGNRCEGAWNEDVFGHCAVFVLGPELATRCVPQETKAEPGAPCAGDGDCTTNLCVPAPGEPAGAARICSAPCDLDPSRDRCAETVHPAATCQDSVYESGAASFALRVCR